MRKFVLPFIIALSILACPAAKAQVNIGAGVSGLKFMGDGSDRPSSIGASLSLGVELNEKARIVLNPSYFFPVDYEYIDNITVNNNPREVQTTETLNMFMLSGLLRYNLLGTNSGGGSIYLAAGPAVAMYTARVDRNAVEDLDVKERFNDLLLDFRLGGELQVGPLSFFAEGDIAPIIATNLQDNPIYSPNRGTLLIGTLGMRINL